MDTPSLETAGYAFSQYQAKRRFHYMHAHLVCQNHLNANALTQKYAKII